MAATSNRLQALEDAVQSLAFVHDPYGKLTKDGKNTYAYDARGRLKRAVTAAGSFTYRVNAQGERVRKTNTKTQESTFYHYDEALHLLAESDASGRVTREYVWLGDTPIALVDQTGTIYAIHSDHINTPRLITDARAVWENSPLGEPFGRDRPNADPQATGQAFTFNLRFPGQYFDPETGTHYNLFRDQYFPEHGRYGQSDPIGLDGGINTYGYVGGDPLGYVDPMGLAVNCKTILKLPFYDIQLCTDDGSDTYPENPDSDPEKFDNIKNSKGKICKDDGSVWERDHSGHGNRDGDGSQWKRWPDKQSWDSGKTPNSVWPDGRIRK